MMPFYHNDWFPFMGLGTTFSWLLSLAVAYLVYKDAQKRCMNGLLWSLPILIPWIGLIFLILYLILRDSGRSAFGPQSPESRRADAEVASRERAVSSALNLLDERYVKGELDREKYLQMKDDIKKQI